MLTISSPEQAAIQGPAVPLIPLIFMDLTSPLRIAIAGVSPVYGGHTWIGCGIVGSMSPVTDSNGERKGLRFTLSSVPADLLAIALAEPMRGKRVTVDIALGDPSTYAILGVHRQFTGTLGNPEISESGSSGTITVNADSRADYMARIKVSRYIDSDQQRLYPGDTSLRFITSQSQHQDIWPSAKWGRQ